jgi:epoxyqueuosine reductase
VAHESRLSGAEIAMQGDEGVGDARPGRQRGRERARVVFAAPGQPAGRFYNPRVMVDGGQLDGPLLLARVRAWARDLGFSQIGVAGVDLSSAEPGLLAWLSNGFHGEMEYMARHGVRRARPAELVPGTASVITARMDYLPATTPQGWQAIEFARMQSSGEAVVSLYARGRDYHKVLRARLQALTDRMAALLGPFGHRVFTDSAPVLEVELAARSGQGWRGKHTLVLDRAGGSMFFLGEIYVDLALPPTEPVAGHCGTCAACIAACPTGAIVAPYRLDARRCISYLTIEHAGAIPEPLRPLMGNRIYGCDDCQLACPWNKFAVPSVLPDFAARPAMQGSRLVDLFAWDEPQFLQRTEGSPIRRIGHERWLRNIAVALGNALRADGDPAVRAALRARASHSSALVREHAAWALAQHPEREGQAHDAQ